MSNRTLWLIFVFIVVIMSTLFVPEVRSLFEKSNTDQLNEADAYTDSMINEINRTTIYDSLDPVNDSIQRRLRDSFFKATK